jgi:GT2 family glycosyltransferase
MPDQLEPAVSIVIVTYNSSAFLPACLTAIQAQTYRSVEVLIMDNASTDDSVEGLEACYPDLLLHVHRLHTNMGFARGVNAGARRARGEWLVVLNPDAFPESRWLEHLLGAAEEFANSFFASRQLRAARPDLLDGEGDVFFASGFARRARFNSPALPPGRPHECFSACAAAAMYPRSSFLDAGGFDDDYFAYHEDVDLGFRLRLRGLRCYAVPSAVVHHVGGGSAGERSKFAIYHGHRNLVWTYFKNMPGPYLWLFLPLHLVTNLIAVLYYGLAGMGATILRAKWDAFRGLGSALAKRRSVQASRSVPVSTIVAQMNLNPLGPLEGWIQRTWP